MVQENTKNYYLPIISYQQSYDKESSQKIASLSMYIRIDINDTRYNAIP